MKKILLIIGFALLYQFISAQDTLTIYFGPEYYPPNDRGIGYVIPRTYYTEGINANGKFYWITMSENFIADDTAWALVFNQGWKNSAINRNTAILIGNYKSKNLFFVLISTTISIFRMMVALYSLKVILPLLFILEIQK